MADLRDCTIPMDPGAQAMKMFSVPRGMQFIVNIDGSTNRLEIVNPIDGRPPFFRLHEVERSSEAIALIEEDFNDDFEG